MPDVDKAIYAVVIIVIVICLGIGGLLGWLIK